MKLNAADIVRLNSLKKATRVLLKSHTRVLFDFALLLNIQLNFSVVLRIVVEIFVKELLCGTVVVTGRFELRGTQDRFISQVGEPRRHGCEDDFSSEIFKSQLVSWRVQNTALIFGQMLGCSQKHYVLRLIIKCIEVRHC